MATYHQEGERPVAMPAMARKLLLAEPIVHVSEARFKGVVGLTDQVVRTYLLAWPRPIASRYRSACNGLRRSERLCPVLPTIPFERIAATRSSSNNESGKVPRHDC